MRSIFVFLCLLSWLAGFSFAEAQPRELPTLVEYLKRSPSYVVGQVRFERSHRVFRQNVMGRAFFEAKIRPNEPIGVLVTETKISLASKRGLRISVAGVPVDIKTLSYDDSTGEVSATSSVLGTRIGSEWIEKQAERTVEKEFGPKLRKAFARLNTLRGQNTLADTGRVLSAVVDSFDDERPTGKPGRPLPTFEGELTLVTPISNDEAVSLGPVVAELENGDRLSTTVMIRVPSGKKLQIRGVIFTTNLGVVLHGRKSTSESLKAITLHSFSATEESGFQVDASNGIDGILNGTQTVLSILATGRSPGRSTPVHDLLEGKVAARVSNLASEHRVGLLRAGVTPSLIRALFRHSSVAPID